MSQAFLHIKTTDGTGFTSVSPFLIKQDLDNKIGPVITAKARRSGYLLVRTGTEAQARNLLKITTFLGKTVTVEFAKN